MRTMSACCFTEYAKSPGCAMLLSFWIVREELKRKKDSGNRGRIVEKRARSLLQARCELLNRRPHGHSACENQDDLQHDRTQPDANDQVLLGVLELCERVIQDVERNT